MKFMLGRLTIDDEALAITLDGRSLPAPPKVVELIAALGARPGDVLSKEALIARLWPQGYADDTTLWQQIYLARKLLARTGAATIETLPRRGYRIVSIERVVLSEARVIPKRARAMVAAAVMVLITGTIALGIHRGAPSPLPAVALRADHLGRIYLHQGTAVSARHAVDEFQEVVRDAPASAIGYADLSEAEVALAQNIVRSRRDALARASADANTALRIDPRSATAHTALAVAAFFAHEPPNKVSAAFKRAIALDNEDAMSHMYYAEFLLTRGDLRPAYAHLRRATDLDPSLGDANVMAAVAAYKLGDPHTAIHYAQEAIGFGAPDKFDLFQTLGYAYAAVGDQDSALHAFRKLRDYDSQASAAGVAYVQSHSKTSVMATGM